MRQGLHVGGEEEGEPLLAGCRTGGEAVVVVVAAVTIDELESPFREWEQWIA